MSGILHAADNVANAGQGAISWGVRKTGINKNFNITTADIGGFILNMNKDKKGVFHAD